MKQRRMIITQNLDKRYIEQIQSLIPNWELIVGRDRIVWEEHLKEAEVIAGWKKEMKELVLQGESSLRWVQTWSAGVNSLPLTDLQAQDIQITSANGVHAYPISETIFALMLSLTRKIHTYVRNQQTKMWHHSGMKLELHGKTVGIFGVGAIGQETAKIAKAFGMKVIGFRHSGKPAEYVDEMYKTTNMNDILPKLDYVVITLPLTKQTYQLFGAEQFERMKSSSFLINISRGEVIDEKALIRALKHERIAGAGLDVFETEPLQEESPLWELENVIVTPHTSGSTEYYDERVVKDILIPNLKNYLEAEPFSINLVDYQKGY
ncbi:D-2-hydroxyacid dehydrogenase [Halalkalibacter kiskunsagensis]|uniref:D-2-hydroxyacid dehydrogenase n=1 Tax=Halalkalibacter kiskunsagensis TaxID=1548599 RepID=A0ABV6KMW0_9BACI